LNTKPAALLVLIEIPVDSIAALCKDIGLNKFEGHGDAQIANDWLLEREYKVDTSNGANNRCTSGKLHEGCTFLVNQKPIPGNNHQHVLPITLRGRDHSDVPPMSGIITAGSADERSVERGPDLDHFSKAHDASEVGVDLTDLAVQPLDRMRKTACAIAIMLQTPFTSVEIQH
jgi:hypothetical protein